MEITLLIVHVETLHVGTTLLTECDLLSESTILDAHFLSCPKLIIIGG